MDPDSQRILSRLLHDATAPVDAAWVMDMLQRYPVFITPALLLLKRNPQSLDEPARRRLQDIVLLNCADRTALTDYIDPADAGWANFYPEATPIQSTTEQTIDDFLTTFGIPSTPEEDSVLEKLIFNPAPADYFADTDEPYDPDDPLALPPELRQDDDEPTETAEPDEGEPATEANAPDVADKSPTPGDESSLMESLSKIFIKQRRYERAYEIISKLSLKYPEKSVYFADQLRFLQKLMINQRCKTD